MNCMYRSDHSDDVDTRPWRDPTQFLPSVWQTHSPLYRCSILDSKSAGRRISIEVEQQTHQWYILFWTLADLLLLGPLNLSPPLELLSIAIRKKISMNLINNNHLLIPISKPRASRMSIHTAWYGDPQVFINGTVQCRCIEPAWLSSNHCML